MSETAIDTLVGLGLSLALRTGSPGVDTVLQNELLYGDVSEIIGDSGAGKTQVFLFGGDISSYMEKRML